MGPGWLPPLVALRRFAQVRRAADRTPRRLWLRLASGRGNGATAASCLLVRRLIRRCAAAPRAQTRRAASAGLGRFQEEILKAPVSALAGVSDADAAALQQAFNVKTVGDLGRNKFFRAAQALALRLPSPPESSSTQLDLEPSRR